MTNNIDQLKTEVNEIKNSLDDLKNKVTTLSEEEKKNKAEALKTQAESTKQKIQAEIDALKDKTDDESKKEKEEAETLLNSFNETMSLYASILNPIESKPSSESEEKEDEKQDEGKGFFAKAKDWVGDQWNDVRDKEKWETEGGKNLLRTAGFVATGVGAVALAYKGVKKLWNRAFGDKDEDKERREEKEKSESKKEEKGFWDSGVGKFIKGAGAVLGVGTGVYYVAHGLYTKNRGLNDLWDWERGKKLDFDTALNYCKGAITNQDNKEGMGYGLDLKYHEDTGEIEAYGEKIKIDKSNRKIEGLKIDFKKYEHMINTAIVIAYLKKNYSGRCSSNSPFDLNGSWQGDINVATQEGSQEAVDGTGNGGRITGIGTAAVASIITAIRSKNIKLGASVLTAGGALGFAGGYVFDTDNIMNKHMPELDDENGRKELTAYLNGMACWESRNQMEEDITESPIKNEVLECVEDIQGTSPELPNLGDVRKIDAIQDPNDATKYIIKVYKRELSAEITGEHGNRKIRLLGISEGSPKIKTDMEKSGLSDLELPLKEGLYMSCLTGFLLDKYHHQGNKYPRFEYTWRTNHAFKSGIYFSKDGTDIRVYSEDAFKNKMPTLFQSKNRKKFIDFLNDGITGENNISIRKK